LLAKELESSVKLDGVMLWVPDVRAAVAFYEAAFGIEAKWVRDEGDYAQMETGDVTLQFADESASAGSGVSIRASRAEIDAPGFQLALTSDDVAAAFARAVGAGAVSAAEPVTKPWGQTLAYVRDLNGVLVELASADD
jgi:lactoylglutathione lyase